MTWKKTLYDYVQDKCQSSIECLAVDPPAYIADESYLNREKIRRQGELAIAQERSIWPRSGETKLRLMNVTGLQDGIVADIVLIQNRQYSLENMEYTEGREERERVTFHFTRNQWQITGIEHLDSELRPYDRQDEDDSTAPPSLPYLNYSILGNTMGTLPRKNRYNRYAAADYANRWWNSYNPAYARLDVDCTNYVSQCIFAGGIPMHYTGKRGHGWWYSGKGQNQELWSYSWAVAHSLQTYSSHNQSVLRGTLVHSPQELEIGDMISYDWNGDGRFQHNTIVTAKDAMGMPLVNAHTVNSSNRYWSYRDSYAWSEYTRYAFVHIDS